eukprot:55814-Chlamydomonas_euryale.AAC.1
MAAASRRHGVPADVRGRGKGGRPAHRGAEAAPCGVCGSRRAQGRQVVGSKVWGGQRVVAEGVVCEWWTPGGMGPCGGCTSVWGRVVNAPVCEAKWRCTSV